MLYEYSVIIYAIPAGCNFKLSTTTTTIYGTYVVVVVVVPGTILVVLKSYTA